MIDIQEALESQPDLVVLWHELTGATVEEFPRDLTITCPASFDAGGELHGYPRLAICRC